jgi:hypothetical protein
MNFRAAVARGNSESGSVIHHGEMPGLQTEAPCRRRHVREKLPRPAHSFGRGKELQFNWPFDHHPHTAVENNLREPGLESKPARLQGAAHSWWSCLAAPVSVHDASQHGHGGADCRGPVGLFAQPETPGASGQEGDASRQGQHTRQMRFGSCCRRSGSGVGWRPSH